MGARKQQHICQFFTLYSPFLLLSFPNPHIKKILRGGFSHKNTRGGTIHTPLHSTQPEYTFCGQSRQLVHECVPSSILSVNHRHTNIHPVTLHAGRTNFCLKIFRTVTILRSVFFLFTHREDNHVLLCDIEQQ